MAISKPPKVFWPLTITAGVNDYIDFTIGGGAEMSARIAAGVYLSIASLLTACEVAMEAPVYVITAGVNDKIDFTAAAPGGGTYAATIAPGAYTSVALLADAAAYAMTAADANYTYTGTDVGGKVRIQQGGDTGHTLNFGTGPSLATSAGPSLGFAAADTGLGTVQNADGAPISAAVAWTATASSSGRVSLASASASVLKFSTGSHAATSARDVLGFGAVDTASGTSHTAASQHQNGWYPERPCVFDSREEYERTTSGTVSLSGAVKLLTFGSAREIRRVEFAWLPEWKTKIAREGASHLNESLERLWLNGFARFRYWPDATVEGTYLDASLDSPLLRAFAPSRDDRMQLYGYSLIMRKVV